MSAYSLATIKLVAQYESLFTAAQKAELRMEVYRYITAHQEAVAQDAAVRINEVLTGNVLVSETTDEHIRWRISAERTKFLMERRAEANRIKP